MHPTTLVDLRRHRRPRATASCCRRSTTSPTRARCPSASTSSRCRARTSPGEGLNRGRWHASRSRGTRAGRPDPPGPRQAARAGFATCRARSTTRFDLRPSRRGDVEMIEVTQRSLIFTYTIMMLSSTKNLSPRVLTLLPLCYHSLFYECRGTLQRNPLSLQEKMILLDKKIGNGSTNCSMVYEDFENDIYTARSSLLTN